MLLRHLGGQLSNSVWGWLGNCGHQDRLACIRGLLDHTDAASAQQVCPRPNGWLLPCLSRCSWLQGPGDNATNSDDPFVLFTGRMYNNAITPGVIRIQQGEHGVAKRFCLISSQPHPQSASALRCAPGQAGSAVVKIASCMQSRICHAEKGAHRVRLPERLPAPALLLLFKTTHAHAQCHRHHLEAVGLHSSLCRQNIS